jgi:hypothetical protein
MGILDRAELLLQAKNYSGSGEWLDEANSHNAQFGSTGDPDTNDPLFLAYTGTQHVYFPGSVGNSVSVVLAAVTIYDYTVTYLGDATATGSETSDGGGVLVLGEAQANFAGLKVIAIDVTADGGGPTLALFDAAGLTEPFATYTDGIPEVWTLNRSATGVKLTVVDRPMFLLGTDDYFDIADDDALDFGALDDLTLMVAFRGVPVDTGSESFLVSKVARSLEAGYNLAWAANIEQLLGRIQDGVVDLQDASADLAARQFEAVVSTLVRDVTGDDDIEMFIDGVGSGTPTADTSTQSLASAHTFRIGANPTPLRFYDGEIHAVVLWREALSDADVVLAGDELFEDAVVRRVIRSPRYGITRVARR